MVRTLTAANQSERDKLKIPRSVQQSIPIKAVYPDGIWTVGRKHSRSWKLTDVNYVAASPEAQRSIIWQKSFCVEKPWRSIRPGRYRNRGVVLNGKTGQRHTQTGKADMRQLYRDESRLTQERAGESKGQSGLCLGREQQIRVKLSRHRGAGLLRGGQ